jgi:hypothetical protein
VLYVEVFRCQQFGKSSLDFLVDRHCPRFVCKYYKASATQGQGVDR